MSEKPQGEGFPLPEDLIKNLERFAVDEKPIEEPVDVIQDTGTLSETVSETTKKLRTSAEVVMDKLKAKDLAKEIKSKRKERENVSRRVGGSDFRKNASEAISSATEKDLESEVYPENKRMSKKEIKSKNFQREIQKDSLKIPRDKLKGVSASRLPDEERIEGKEIPEDYVAYKDINKEKPPIEFYGNNANELSDASGIEGKELQFEGMEIRREDVEEVKSIDELLTLIDDTYGIQGSQEFFDKEKMRMIIESVRDGELGIEYVTRSAGLRRKMIELLSEKDAPVSETAEIIETQETTEIVDETEKEVEEMLAYHHRNLPKDVPTIELDSTKPAFVENVSEIKDIKFDELVDEEPELVKTLAHKVEDMKNAEKRVFEAKAVFEQKSLWGRFMAKIKEENILELEEAKKEKEKTFKAYSKAFYDLVEFQVEEELQRLEKLHANSKEKRANQILFLNDIPTSFLEKYNGVLRDYFQANSNGEGLSMVDIINDKTLPKELRTELKTEIFPEIVAKQLTDRFAARLLDQLRK